MGRSVGRCRQAVVTGYYSSSRRAAQTPCEDIQIRFPLPEPWIYLFRVERRFKYGSVHSATRRPGRIRGLERLTQLAQGILPPSLIEVSAGLAKYEHVFKAIVWRIDQLPERNEGRWSECVYPSVRVRIGVRPSKSGLADFTIQLIFNARDHSTFARLAVWLSGSVVACVGEVTRRRARLISRWATVFERVHHLGMQPTNKVSSALHPTGVALTGWG